MWEGSKAVRMDIHNLVDCWPAHMHGAHSFKKVPLGSDSVPASLFVGGGLKGTVTLRSILRKAIPSSSPLS